MFELIRNLSIEEITERIEKYYSEKPATAYPKFIERNLAIIASCKRGPIALREVGIAFGITSGRVRQILAKHERIMKTYEPH